MNAKARARKNPPTRRAIKPPPSFLLEAKEESEEVRKAKLVACEQYISAAGKAFVEAAIAMSIIKRDNLHKVAGFDGFKEYLAQRWGICRSHGYRLADAGEILEEVQEIGAGSKKPLPLPTTLGACLELKKVLPHDGKRRQQLTNILGRAREVAKAEIKGANGVAPSHEVDVVIEAEHIRQAVQEAEGDKVRPPKSREAGCEAARRRVEGVLTELRGILDEETDRELLEAAENLLKRLAAECAKSPKKGG